MRQDLTTVIDNQYKRFTEIAASHRAVTFSQECMFAKEALAKNNYLASVAERNVASLESAILNVAAAGISLSPVLKHAYLVPRKGTVCLDVSYQGLIHLAMEGGAIIYVRCYMVREKDDFKFTGIDKKPEFNMEPFKDRGEYVGGFCTIKLKSGEYLTHVMNVEAINDIRDRSDSYKAFLSKGVKCPWVTDYEEMAKKTIAKQASKLWPKTDAGMRLEQAISAENETNGIDFEGEKKTQESVEQGSGVREVADEKSQLLQQIKDELNAQTKNMTVDEKMDFCKRVCGVDSFNDLKKLYPSKLKEVLEKLKPENRTITTDDIPFE